MSGHSKWATTKRHKAAIDAKRGKIFSVIGKEISLAARDGGGDPDFNPRLRTLVLKGKSANMPADNIERAIKKGTGELGGTAIEELLYEGYGPSGVGIIIEVTTDNKNRSASAVRSTLTKNGGKLAGTGALTYNFKRKGQFLIGSEKCEEDSLMEIALDNDAEDVIVENDHFEVLCEVVDFDKLSQALCESGIEPDSAELVYVPNSLVKVEDETQAKQVLRLIELLDDLEDVKSVHSNYDVDEDLLDN